MKSALKLKSGSVEMVDGVALFCPAPQDSRVGRKFAIGRLQRGKRGSVQGWEKPIKVLRESRRLTGRCID